MALRGRNWSSGNTDLTADPRVSVAADLQPGMLPRLEGSIEGWWTLRHLSPEICLPFGESVSG